MLHTFLTLKYYIFFVYRNMKLELALSLAAILVLGALVPGLTLTSQLAFADDKDDGYGDGGGDDGKKHGDDGKKHGDDGKKHGDDGKKHDKHDKDGKHDKHDKHDKDGKHDKHDKHDKDGKHDKHDKDGKA